MNLDLRVCARAVLDEVAEDRLVVVANDEDFADLRDPSDSCKAMRDDRVAGDFEKRLCAGVSGLLRYLLQEHARAAGNIPWAHQARAV